MDGLFRSIAPAESDREGFIGCERSSSEGGGDREEQAHVLAVVAHGLHRAGERLGEFERTEQPAVREHAGAQADRGQRRAVIRAADPDLARVIETVDLILAEKTAAEAAIALQLDAERNAIVAGDLGRIVGPAEALAADPDLLRQQQLVRRFLSGGGELRTPLRKQRLIAEQIDGRLGKITPAAGARQSRRIILGGEWRWPATASRAGRSQISPDV